MIIFGTRTAYIKSVKLNNAVCPHCGTGESIVLNIFRKHVHVFWIPFFPLWKKVVSQCQHCKNGLYYNEMPTDLQRESDLVKRDTRGPLWQFSGLAVILVLVLFSVFLSK